MKRIPADTAAICRLRVGSVFRAAGLSARQKRLDVWNAIIKSEIELGTQFIVTKTDRAIYVVLWNDQVLPLPPEGRGGDRVYSYLHAMYGIEITDATAKSVYALMRVYAFNHGIEVELRRFSAYKTKEHISYLSSYDGRMWRLDGNEIVRVPAGENSVFFIDDDRGSSVEPDIQPHGLLFQHLASPNFTELSIGGSTPLHQQRVLIAWMFALAFPDLIPNKPVIMLEGAQGSGKTLCILLIQLALMGRGKAMGFSANQEADFGVLLLRSPIALLDNMDSYIPWVADSVCRYVTEGEFPKRKLYSDDEEIAIKPDSFLAVASKNPSSFRREDTVDRLLVLRLDRRTEFARVSKLKEMIANERPKLLGEYLYYVNKIVAAIRDGAYDEAVIETHRMADFAAFLRVVGTVLGWPDDETQEVLDSLQNERDAFGGEEDPLAELIHFWLNYRPKGHRSSVWREVTIHELYVELQHCAGPLQIDFVSTYKSPRVLAQRIRSSHLLRHFEISSYAVDNYKRYRIRRHTDPKLELVEEPIVKIDDDDDT